MPAVFDPALIVRALVDESDYAAEVAKHIRKPALKAFEAVLKAKSFSAADLRAISGVLGPEQLVLVVDALSDSTLRSALKRLDPHHPNAAGAIDTAWARKHLVALGIGHVAPTEKPKPLDKLLPAKSRTTTKLVALAEEIGLARFIDSLESMTASAAATMVKKLDPKNPRAKGKAADVDTGWAKRRIAELAGIELPAEAESGEHGAEWFAKLQRIYATKAQAC